MSILPLPSLNALITKTIKARKKATAALSQQDKMHTMHYTLNGFGRLPAPMLERINRSLEASTADQYPHADAHLRLIMAMSNKFKQPLTLEKLPKLRQEFATNMVSMQDPKVWKQSNGASKLTTSDKVYWQDKLIADADGGDMTIRCYQQSKHDSGIQGFNKQAADQTVMLFFHGGGFCIGDLDTHHEFCYRVCAITGWSVVSVDYRLAPEHPAPTALRDCLSAYAWLAEHCHTLGALPSRIVLVGDSAGGCLVISVAQQLSAPDAAQWTNLGLDEDRIITMLQDLPRPLAQLPLYPVTDIEAEHPSWGLYGQGLFLDHNDVEVFDAAYMQQSPLAQSHALVSPMHGNNAQICPSYIIAAELDILRDEALVYAKQLQEKDIEVKTYTVLGAPHGFIHLLSVHQGIGRETDYIIKEFSHFVRQLLVA